MLVLVSLAFSTSSRSSDAITLPVKGGWSFTAYSNREPFSEAYVQSFSSVFSSAEMQQLGLYPGNAGDHMIQSWQDAEYLEQGNIAVMQSHGNIFGPDLDYVPGVASRAVNWYEWGDLGRTQWVAIGGCDVLGFTIAPSGAPSPYWPAAARWNTAFRGITGILGYRSSSWYRPQDRGLAANTARIFATRLTAGDTFYLAWRHAADYLHRVIGRTAEIAVFASSQEALSDTLYAFKADRLQSLDVGSVRRTHVGRGWGPCYHYPSKVDENGIPIDYRICPPKPFQKSFDAPATLFAESFTEVSRSLAVLEVTSQGSAVAMALGDLSGTYEMVVDEAGLEILRIWSFPINPSTREPQVLVNRIQDAVQDTGVVLVQDSLPGDSDVLDGSTDVSLVPHIDSGSESVRMDTFGITLEYLDKELRIVESPMLYLSDTGRQQVISMNRTMADDVFNALTEEGWRVYVQPTEVIYNVDSSADRVTPSIAVNAIIERSRLRQSIQILQ